VLPRNTTSKPDVQTVAADPQWLPVNLMNGETLQFLHVTRPERASVAFLTDEYLQAQSQSACSFGLRQVESALPTSASPAGFVFHSAFCRSTLLTRALDLPGVAHGLQEPQIINDVAVMERHKRLDRSVLDPVMNLLARPVQAGERVVIKPSNEANLLIPTLLTAQADARAILLYAPLDRFLRSVAGKALWGRGWARNLYLNLRSDHPLPLGFSERELFGQTDLQIAALVWLTHLDQFAAARARFGDRVRFLDSEVFIARKADTLAAAARHLGLAGTADLWAERADSAIFTEHSKVVGSRFDGSEAKDRADSVALNEEVGLIDQWVDSLAKHIGLQLQPPPEADLMN
jgi:hypothetical protein